MKECGQGLVGSSFLAKKPRVKKHTASPWENPTLLSRVCTSLTLLVVAKATTKRVCLVRSRSEAVQRDSKQGPESHLKTKSKFQEMASCPLDLEVSKDFRRSDRS